MRGIVFCFIGLIQIACCAQEKKTFQTRAHLESLPRVVPTLGESAIVDKESGRVYWQGGRQSLFESTVGHSYLSDQDGILRHVRATIFSIILWISFVRWLANWALRQEVLIAKWKTILHPSERILEIAKTIARMILLSLAYLPNFGRTFTYFIYIMYIVESYCCSTRKYLANLLTCPDNIEIFMEKLRREEPSVKWRIRCYHYEKRKLMSLLLLLPVFAFWRKDNDDTDKMITGPSIFTKKVITHQAEEIYRYGSFKDETISGIWRQARSGTSIMATFTKISLHKLLLFSDTKTRKDYFSQQKKFINAEGSKDIFAEFSTRVDVNGYREKVLAVRSSKGIHQLYTLKYFWLFTLLGLTVPYRIRFSNNCDELKVAVVKETSVEETEKVTESTSKENWFLRPWFTKLQQREDEDESFRKRMQEIALYEREKIASELDLIISAKNEIEKVTDIVGESVEVEITNQKKWFPRPWFTKQEVEEDSFQERREENVLDEQAKDIELDVMTSTETQVEENEKDRTAKDHNNLIISTESNRNKTADQLSHTVKEEDQTEKDPT